MIKRFKEVLEIKNGKNQKAVENPDGPYAIYGSGGVMGHADDYICDANTVVIGRKGSINNPIFVEEPFWNVDTAFGLVAKEEILLPRYLFYFCKKYNFEKLNTTVTIPSLTKANLLNVEIDIPHMADQENIVKRFQKLESILARRNQQLRVLDDLIKARFVEMFGDPEINNYSLPTMPMTDVCDIIDGDRGNNYPTQEDFSDNGYCLFLNAKNVTANGFVFDNCMFIAKEKDEMLRKGRLNRGDVVLTTRGTIGNLAFYDDSVGYDNVRINSGMVILRMDHNKVLERFFIEQFKMLLGTIKNRIASGSAQPQLPISIMNKIVMLMPPMELQKQFAAFVTQVEKSKVAIQKALDETQLLFDSLMQKYFG